MNVESKLTILDQVYAIYDHFAASLELACQKKCDHCCTTSVTLTTLEGYKIIAQLTTDKVTDLIHNIQLATEVARFRLQVTTNRLAQLCAASVAPPQETANFNPQACPLLSDHQCPIYQLRPFGCRCLVSHHNCREKGYAEMDDFILSVNTVFLQFIEHVDAGGCSGNLVDVLQAMSLEQNRKAYDKSALHCSANGLIPNQPLEVLMIPPEHRNRMAPLLQDLRQITIS